MEKENKGQSDYETFVNLETIIAPGKEDEFWRRASATSRYYFAGETDAARNPALSYCMCASDTPRRNPRPLGSSLEPTSIQGLRFSNDAPIALARKTFLQRW